MASQQKWVAAFRLWHLHACSWTPGGLAMCHLFAAGDAGAFMDDRHPGSGVTNMVQKQKSTMSDPLMNYKLYLL